jgi:hypothetical protein
MTEAAVSATVPPLSAIDVVAKIIVQRVAFYRALAIAATLLVPGIVLLATLTLPPVERLSWLAKFGSSASLAAIGGTFPFIGYLRWRGLENLCTDFRAQAELKLNSPESISDSVFAHMSDRFWRLYDRSWEAKA